MVLLATIGNLGKGKTLSMAFLLWHNWFNKNRKVYSNLHLFGIPYYFVNSLDKLDEMKDGIVGLDELWFWVDAFTSRKQSNRLASNVLMKSRKKDLTILFTTQTVEQLNPRVRKVIDFSAIPSLNTNETICKVNIFHGISMNIGTYIKSIYFRTELVFDMYDTKEIVEMSEKSDEPMKLIFQEHYNRSHGYLCGCDECKTIYFKTWEEADKYGYRYWEKIYKKNGNMIPI